MSDVLILPRHGVIIEGTKVSRVAWVATISTVVLLVLTMRSRFTHDTSCCNKEVIAVNHSSFRFEVIAEIIAHTCSLMFPKLWHILAGRTSFFMSAHYIRVIHIGAIIRLILNAISTTLPFPFDAAASILGVVHTTVIWIIMRFFYVLANTSRSDQSNPVAISIHVSIWKSSVMRIYGSIAGEDMTVCASIRNHHIPAAEVCAICHDPLSVAHFRRTLKSQNISMNRPHVFGSYKVFKSLCGHLFHRTCIMRWIAEKPIWMRTDVRNQSIRNSFRRHSASCPLCGKEMELKYTYVVKWNFAVLFGW
jgi:hypothetical protein